MRCCPMNYLDHIIYSLWLHFWKTPIDIAISSERLVRPWLEPPSKKTWKPSQPVEKKTNPVACSFANPPHWTLNASQSLEPNHPGWTVIYNLWETIESVSVFSHLMSLPSSHAHTHTHTAVPTASPPPPPPTTAAPGTHNPSATTNHYYMTDLFVGRRR